MKSIPVASESQGYVPVDQQHTKQFTFEDELQGGRNAHQSASQLWNKAAEKTSPNVLFVKARDARINDDAVQGTCVGSLRKPAAPAKHLSMTATADGEDRAEQCRGAFFIMSSPSLQETENG